MKYVIIQGDGMGDFLESSAPTTLDEARTPNFDRIAGCGLFGLNRTIPSGMPPGSDIGHLSLFGYDPGQYYTGRSPLEALAMGVELGPDDVAFRMNMVTLAESGEGETMADYSAGHIDTPTARELILSLADAVVDQSFQFYPGISYRHLMVWRNGIEEMKTVPPHDITGQLISRNLPKGAGADKLRGIMETSKKIIADHPRNLEMIRNGKKGASQVWFWGQGKSLRLPSFFSKYQLKGAVISAVDLVRGVATGAGFDIITVPGATGFLDTDYSAKGEYALKGLEDHDLVFVHIEAPDEAGHMGDRKEKIKAIEAVDQKIVGPLLKKLPEIGPFKIMICSDHATPVTTRTHCEDPVPFSIATGAELLAAKSKPVKYSEKKAAGTGVLIDPGHKLMEKLLAWPE